MRFLHCAMALVGLLAALGTGCQQSSPEVSQAASNIQGAAKFVPIIFRGRCDGSAAASVAGRYLVTASDETDASGENVLAVYDPLHGGEPVATLAVNDAIGIPKEGKRSKREADLEAAATLGGRTYWIASHGLNKDGKERPTRYQFFATQSTGTSLTVIGSSYHDLKRDIATDPRLQPYLQAALEKNPEETGGFNIEGMTGTPEGTLLIAFRNPVIKGKALLVPLLNPAAVVGSGAKAQFGAPILLRLGAGHDLGVRDIAYWPERKVYVLIAGSYLAGSEEKSGFHLLLWDGKGTAKSIEPAPNLMPLNAPEAVFIQPGVKDRVLVLSDDGMLDDCKSKPQSEERFTGAWYSIP